MIQMHCCRTDTYDSYSYRTVNPHITSTLESVRGPATASKEPDGMVFAPRIAAPGVVTAREQASVVAGTSSFAFQVSEYIIQYIQ